MTNDFKALIMNVDEIMVVISLRWKSPSSTFIRLSKCFILVAPRVDLIPNVGLAWLHLEGYNQVACCACLLGAKQVKCFSLKDCRYFDALKFSIVIISGSEHVKWVLALKIQNWYWILECCKA